MDTPAPTSSADPAPESSSPPASRRRVLWEVLIIFGGTTLLCSVLWQLRRVIPFIQRHIHELIWVAFVYIPTFLLRKRKEDFRDYGLTIHPIGRNLMVFLVVSLIVFPLFTVGFYVYYQMVCAAAIAGTPLPAQIRSLCRRYVGSWRNVHVRLPPRFAEMSLVQLIVVALPEEYFFRGYIQSQLNKVWPPAPDIYRHPIGRSLLATSVLFALGHLLVDGNPLRLAVFFPSLAFGWMRQATGSVLASILFHACCNLISDVLHRLFF